MSQDVLKQSLSALIDNEAEELELRRVLNASHEPEMRATWSRYQIARASMRNKSANTQIDLSASIMASIEAEPALFSAAADQLEIATPSVKVRTTPWIGRIAVAASVTLAVLGGVRFYNQDSAQQEAMLVQSEQRLPAVMQSHSPAILASFSAEGEQAPILEAVSGQDSWYALRLPSYLRQHAQQASFKTEGSLPYARAASLEGQ